MSFKLFRIWHRTFPTMSSSSENSSTELSLSKNVKPPIGNPASLRYTKKKRIGKGGFASVFLAARVSDNKLFAMKVIEVQNVSDENAKKTQKEIGFLSEMNHENIVRYVEAYSDKRVVHIIMEYCQWGDLKSFLDIQKRPLFEVLILDVFVQVSLAIEYLHKRGIIHRDIKPQNIFISEGNKCKLGDFGLTRLLENSTVLATSTVGTFLYMAPEMWSRGVQYRKKADIWALGCVLYHMCGLKAAFNGSQIGALSYAICNEEYDPLPEFYSDSLQQIVKSLLTKQPDLRPSIETVLKEKCLKYFLKRYALEDQLMRIMQSTPEDFRTRHESEEDGSKTPLPTPQETTSFLSMLCEQECWEPGLSPLLPQDGGEYSEVDWAELPAHVDWLGHWKAAVHNNRDQPWWWLVFPPIWLPESFDNRKLVIWLSRSWETPDLIVCGRFHRSTPATATPLHLALHIRVNIFRWKQEKNFFGFSSTKVAPTEPDLELKQTENIYIDHQPRDLFRFSNMPWGSIVDTMPPKASVRVTPLGSVVSVSKVEPFHNPVLEEMRTRVLNPDWLLRGLQPLLPNSEGEYAEMDWATNQGTGDWRSEWKDAVRGEMGWLPLPPLVLPRQLHHRVVLLWMARLSSSDGLTVRTQYHRNLRRNLPVHFRLKLIIHIPRKTMSASGSGGESDVLVLEKSENVRVNDNPADLFTFPKLPWATFKEDAPPKAFVRIERPSP